MAPKRINWSKDRPVKPDHDPMLMDLRSLLANDKRTYYGMANASGLAPATLQNIVNGKTRRPQGVTIQMAYAMLGYRLKPVRSK